MSKNRYKTEEKQSLFSVWDIFVSKQNIFFMKDAIEDRKSKYSVTLKEIYSKDDVKKYFKEIQKDKFYKKATHNTYAYRILLEDNSVLDWKNDDGELGWWNCILNVLRNKNIVNVMVIVTRYYGWIHLNNDRFKHLINSTKIILENVELKKL